MMDKVDGNSLRFRGIIAPVPPDGLVPRAESVCSCPAYRTTPAQAGVQNGTGRCRDQAGQTFRAGPPPARGWAGGKAVAKQAVTQQKCNVAGLDPHPPGA